MVGEFGVEVDVDRAGNVAGGEVVPAIGLRQGPADVEQPRRRTGCLQPQQLVGADEDIGAVHFGLLLPGGPGWAAQDPAPARPAGGAGPGAGTAGRRRRARYRSAHSRRSHHRARVSSTTWRSPSRVNTSVALSPFGSLSWRRTWSGTMSAPRFLITT